MKVATSIIKGLLALLKEARFDGVTSVGATNIAGIIKSAERYLIDESFVKDKNEVTKEDDNEVTV